MIALVIVMGCWLVTGFFWASYRYLDKGDGLYQFCRRVVVFLPLFLIMFPSVTALLLVGELDIEDLRRLLGRRPCN